MKNLLKKYLWVALVATMTSLWSCSNELPYHPGENPDGVTSTWTVPEYKVERCRIYSKVEFFEHIIKGYRALMDPATLHMVNDFVGSIKSDNYIYHEDVIRYKSIDHKGEPIYLSGIVCYKSDYYSSCEVKTIVIDCHATITDDASAPSVAGSIGGLHMLNNPAVVVSADYQGYGVSLDALHPYLNENLTARQQVDLLKAAIDYISYSVKGVTFSRNLSAFAEGYSQGGAVALAVHRHLEREEPSIVSALNFKGSVCGDGPYNLEKTFEAYMNQGYVSIPVILPMIVRSMMECYPELFNGLSIEDFFNTEFLATGGGLLDLIDCKMLNVIAFNGVFGTSNPLNATYPIQSIFKPEALLEGSRQMTAMKAAFERNNCIKGWTPKAPVAFYHSKDDTVVPYCNLDDTSAWPAASFTISNPAKSGVDHMAGAMLFYMDLMLNKKL